MNLAPADPLIQHRKGLIGALVVEPRGSSWPKLHTDLQTVTGESVRLRHHRKRHEDRFRSSTNASHCDGEEIGGTQFDELVLAMQTDAYMYQKAPVSLASARTAPILVYTNAPAFNYRSSR